MSNRVHDYDLLEREYITGEMGLRELGRSHGITTHSLLTVQSKKRQWVRKRAEYREKMANQTVIYLADETAARYAREMRVRDNAIDAIDEAITKMRRDLADTIKVVKEDGSVIDTGEPIMRVRPTEIVHLIDRLNVLFGRPSNITEERNLGLNLAGNISSNPDLLRGFIEATRGLGSESGGAADSPIPRTGGARKN